MITMTLIMQIYATGFFLLRHYTKLNYKLKMNNFKNIFDIQMAK